MSYATSIYRSPAGLRATWLPPAAKAIGEGLTWLGGGALFAAALYVMAALPGLLE